MPYMKKPERRAIRQLHRRIYRVNQHDRDERIAHYVKLFPPLKTSLTVRSKLIRTAPSKKVTIIAALGP
jgi:hypothetical protein